MDQNQNQPSSNPTPQTPPSTMPGQPSVPPTEGNAPSPSNAGIPQQPAQPGATPPVNKSKKGLIAAIIVFLVLLMAVAALMLTQNQLGQAQPTPTAMPSTSVENTEPTVIPTQNVEAEVEAVDTGASESSEMQEVQEDIKSLQ